MLALPRRHVLAGLLGSGAALEATMAQATVDKPPDKAVAFDIRAFGATGTAKGDDTAAFRALHAALRQHQADDDRERGTRPPLEFVVLLPPGLYRTRWNRWTWGIRRLTVIGYGAQLQCLHSGPFDVDQAPLISNRDHYWTWDGTGPAYGGPTAKPEDYGRLIESARAGDHAVTLKTDKDVGLFRPGSWVLIQSLAQQLDGYPPNPRRFERARVVALDRRTVRLDRPLLHQHSADCPEDASLATFAGRARLVAIDRPDCPLALSQAFLGLGVLSNPNHATREPVSRTTREILGLSGTLDALVRDCALIALGVSQCGTVRIEHCTLDYTEPDKLVDELVFDNCRIGSLQQCTGVNRLALRDCTVLTDAQILSREAVVDGCSFPGPSLPGTWRRGINLEGTAPTRRLTVTNCRFFGHDEPTNHPLGGEIWIRVPIDGRQLRPTTPNQLVAQRGSTPYRQLVELLDEDWPLRVTGRAGVRFGTCRAIAGGLDAAVFTLAVDGPIEVGDMLHVPRLEQLTVRDCALNRIQPAYPAVPRLTWERQIEDSRRLKMRIRSDVATRQLWLPGFVRRIACSVIKPYRGAAPDCFMIVHEQPPVSGALELIIDLKNAGARELTAQAAHLKPRDRLASAATLPDDRYVAEALILITPRLGDAPAAAPGTDADQAIVDLTIEVDNPLARCDA